MKTKKVMLAFLFVLAMTGLKAQQKNEYMIIEFNYNLKNELQISIDGKTYIEEKADYSPGEKASHNANPLLKKYLNTKKKDGS